MGGNPELIESGKEGILIPYNNELELKKSIRQLLDDSDKQEMLTKNAQLKVRQFTEEKMLRETVELFTSL